MGSSASAFLHVDLKKSEKSKTKKDKSEKGGKKNSGRIHVNFEIRLFIYILIINIKTMPIYGVSIM